jgi:guanyl-specific ribonuclease Sa
VVAGAGAVGGYALAEENNTEESKDEQSNPIPQRAKDVAGYAEQHNGSPPPGYKGGKTFENDGREGAEVLPKTDSEGEPITYKEYDVNPYTKGNRGEERVVIGSNGSQYYSDNHYKKFTRIK